MKLKITILMLCLLVPPLLSQQVYTLQEDGLWSNTAIWSPSGIPGPTDTIRVLNAGLELSTDGSREVAKIHFGHSSAVISIDGTGGALTITDSIYWEGGVFHDGTGDGSGTLTITAGATIYMDAVVGLGSARLLDNGATLINEGTIVVDSADFRCGDSTVIDNRGLIDIAGDNAFRRGINDDVEFYNTGTVRKSAGTGNSRVESGYNFFNQNGTIEVLSGTLEIDGAVTFTDGNYYAAAGAILSLWHGQHTFEGTLTGAPDGVIEMSVGGTDVFLNGDVILDFQGSGFQWRDGNIVGPGTVTIPEAALLQMVSTNNWDLQEGAILVNEGTIRCVDGGDLGIESASTLDNRGLIDLQTDIEVEAIGFDGAFLNSGAILKSGGSDITTITSGVRFHNQDGIIDVQSGTLSFNSPSTFSDGTYQVAADAVIRFWNNEYSFEGALFGEPQGRIEASNSGSELIILDEAVFDFRGTGFYFTDGAIQGGGTLIVPEGALMTMDGTTTFTLTDTTTLQNEGTIVVSGGGDFQIQEQSTVDNRGLIDLTSDAELDASSGGGFFLNHGTLRKSGGDGLSLVRPAWTFDNLNGGTIEANSGEFDFRLATFSNQEGGIIRGGATIEVNDAFLNDGIVAPGNSIGALTHLGNYQPSASGVLKIELGGLTAGSEHDQLIVDGDAALDGTLNVQLVAGFVPDQGDAFTIITADEVAGSYADVTAPGGLFISVETTDTSVVLLIDSVGAVSIEDPLADEESVIPRKTELFQNYPNPFNPSTTIGFNWAGSGEAVLSIYDIQGRRVREQLSIVRSPGEYSVVWDGRNDNEQQVASGVYFYQITVNNQRVASRRMMLVR